MQRGRVDYAHAPTILISKRWDSLWKRLLSELASDSVFTVCVHILIRVMQVVGYDRMLIRLHLLFIVILT